MPRKNRPYKRGEPFRNARLFVIVCEGAKREVEYFKFFQQFSQRVKIEPLPPRENASAPNHFLSRAQEFVDADTNDFNANDSLWFVSDVDHWQESVLRDVSKESKQRTNWHLAVSNPCFEVWLFVHFKDISELPKLYQLTAAKRCAPTKQAVDAIMPGGYKVEVFAPRIEEAIRRAKANDNDTNHFMPDLPDTKLYQLAEQMLEYMGQEWERTKQSRRGL